MTLQAKPVRRSIPQHCGAAMLSLGTVDAVAARVRIVSEVWCCPACNLRQAAPVSYARATSAQVFRKEME